MESSAASRRIRCAFLRFCEAGSGGGAGDGVGVQRWGRMGSQTREALRKIQIVEIIVSQALLKYRARKICCGWVEIHTVIEKSRYFWSAAENITLASPSDHPAITRTSIILRSSALISGHALLVDMWPRLPHRVHTTSFSTRGCRRREPAGAPPEMWGGGGGERKMMSVGKIYSIQKR